MRVVAILVAAVTALVLVASAAAAQITRQAKTKSYSLTLVVGPSEQMYSQAELKAMHPKLGEVMVGGAMMAGSMSAMKGETVRHLEVHVRSLSTGATVTKVTPQISLEDASAKTMMSKKLEVVAMEGAGEGRSDLHYGNNVSVKLGDVYKVSVVVHGEKASFIFKAV
jgi:hypothetical protein